MMTIPSLRKAVERLGAPLGHHIEKGLKGAGYERLGCERLGYERLGHESLAMRR